MFRSRRGGDRFSDTPCGGRIVRLFDRLRRTRPKETQMARRKEVLTTGEVAKICQVAPRTVSKWFDTGVLKGYRVPGSKDRRIPVEGLVRFMRSHGMPMRGLDTGQTRILVISPDREFRRSLATALGNQRSIECSTAESAFGAGTEAARNRPHVILVDTSTPDLRNARLRETAHDDATLSSVKVVALVSEPTSVESLKRQGYDDCLVRPFEVSAAIRLIDGLLSEG